MKHLLYFVIVLFSSYLFSQNKYITRNGTVNFEASVPYFEDVKAKNTSATAIINIENGEFAVLVLVKGFRFKNALMEEHFNENYAESDTYPKAIFKGQIIDFSLDKLKNERQDFKIDGELSFHGKTKKINNLNIAVSINDTNSISMSGILQVKASDFDIKIPKVVANKIAEDIIITYLFDLNNK